MSNVNKIVSIKAYREIKRAEEEDFAYQARILALDKLALLEEMVRFQEERSKNGQLTPTMMIRGRYLFKALEKTAETEALRSLSKSYRRHLDHELAAYLETKKSN